MLRNCAVKSGEVTFIHWGESAPSSDRTAPALVGIGSWALLICCGLIGAKPNLLYSTSDGIWSTKWHQTRANYETEILTSAGTVSDRRRDSEVLLSKSGAGTSCVVRTVQGALSAQLCWTGVISSKH